MSEKYKKVILVNERDEVIGCEHLQKAKESGDLRRAVRVFVFDESNRLLIQKRSATVFSPNLLDQSVGGHVDEGESYHAAAVREMQEELGLVGVPLEEIVTSYRTEHHFNGIYRATIAGDQSIPFNHDEVAEIIWFDPDELSEKMRSFPDEFTSSFPVVWQDLRDTLIPS